MSENSAQEIRASANVPSDCTDGVGASSEPMLAVHNLSVTYGSGPDAVQAIARLDFEVMAGDFVCVIGPSGCGKTTMLRALAGLLRPSAGSVSVAGHAVTGPPPDVATVFQDYTRSLLPWMSVRKNITFPLAAKGVSKAERNARAEDALGEVGLHGVGSRYPWQLSGGMQQRVAIARAVAYQPDVLLMDEPFAAVDAQVRADLEDLILGVQAATGVTVLLVTHDIDESVYLGHRVLALSHRPTTVRRSFDVPLPFPRNQLTTRSADKFIELRTELFRMIQAERSSTAPEARPAE